MSKLMECLFGLQVYGKIGYTSQVCSSFLGMPELHRLVIILHLSREEENVDSCPRKGGEKSLFTCFSEIPPMAHNLAIYLNS